MAKHAYTYNVVFEDVTDNGHVPQHKSPFDEDGNLIVTEAMLAEHYAELSALWNN